MPARRRLQTAAAMVVLVAGCGSDARQPDAGPTETTRHPPGCLGAPLLGVAGTTGVDRFTVRFRRGDGWSTGDPVTVVVPPDLTGLTVAVVAGGHPAGLGRVVLDEEVLLDVDRDDPELTATVGPFFHVPVPAGAVSFPMSPGSSLRAGCLRVHPVALAALSEAEVVFVSRRRPLGGAIDINAVVVGGTRITAAELEIAFDFAGRVYAQTGGLRLGAVQTHSLARSSAFVDGHGDAAGRLRASFHGGDEGRLNVYFVQDFLAPGSLGMAAAVPGPNGLHGTVGSGLIISVDSHLDRRGGLDLRTLGETLAHEIGHQLGLFHTTESGGAEHDGLEDTARCTPSQDQDGDGSLAAEECVGSGGGNVMFWTSGDLPQDTLSPSQRAVLQASVLVR